MNKEDRCIKLGNAYCQKKVSSFSNKRSDRIVNKERGLSVSDNRKRRDEMPIEEEVMGRPP